MKKFTIKGMSCAACSARVEKAVKSLNGVSFCAVNLLTNSMEVETSLDDKEIISAVRKAGYDASVKQDNKLNINKENNYLLTLFPLFFLYSYYL